MIRIVSYLLGVPDWGNTKHSTYMVLNPALVVVVQSSFNDLCCTWICLGSYNHVIYRYYRWVDHQCWWLIIGRVAPHWCNIWKICFHKYKLVNICVCYDDLSIFPNFCFSFRLLPFVVNCLINCFQNFQLYVFGLICLGPSLS